MGVEGATQGATQGPTDRALSLTPRFSGVDERPKLAETVSPGYFTRICRRRGRKFGKPRWRGVAQIFNLLYRRFGIGRPSGVRWHLRNPSRAAECNSAIQQIENLRYKCEICWFNAFSWGWGSTGVGSNH